MTDRKLPKSLHTISVLAAIGREHLCAKRNIRALPLAPDSIPEAIAHACWMLGLDDLDDAYRLRDRAADSLRKALLTDGFTFQGGAA